MKSQSFTFCIVLLFLIVPVMTFSQSTEPSYPKTNDKTQTSKEEHRPTEKQAVNSGTIQTTHPSQDSGTGNQAHTYVKSPDVRISDLTFWLVIIAGIQAAIFIGHGIVMFIQARRLRQTIETQDRLGKIELRAYLSVKPSHCSFEKQADKMRCIFHMSIENLGRTPARGVKWAMNTIVLNEPFPEEFDILAFIDHLPKQPIGDIGISHGDVGRFITVIYDSSLSESDIAALNAPEGKKRIYVVGTIWYTDVLKDSHFTNFCGALRWNAQYDLTLWDAGCHNDTT